MLFIIYDVSQVYYVDVNKNPTGQIKLKYYIPHT